MTNPTISQLLFDCSIKYGIMAVSTESFMSRHPAHPATYELNKIANECSNFSSRFGGGAILAITEELKHSAQKIHDASKEMEQAIESLNRKDDIFKYLAGFITKGGALASAIISEDKIEIGNALNNMFLPAEN
jgi:hypothetical protein